MHCPCVSLIVPCYNAAAHIDRCLDSIVEQDFTDWEVILINDGSTDLTGTMCDRRAAAHPGITVLHQPNRGVSAARNRGLETARGKFIMFVDSDDMLLPGCLTALFRMMRDDTEMVFAGYQLTGENAKPFALPEVRTCSYSASRLAKELFNPTDFPYQGFVFTKIFLASVIKDNNLRFDESIVYNEDRLFTFQYLKHVSKGLYTTLPIYLYNQHSGSAMAAIEGQSFYRFETDLDAMIEMCKCARHFREEELIMLIKRAVCDSYCRNISLNKKFGDNNCVTRRRLRMKLGEAVSFREYCVYRVKRFLSRVKYMIMTFLRRCQLSM